MMSVSALQSLLNVMGEKSLAASAVLGSLSSETKNHALECVAVSLEKHEKSILEANSADVDAARKNGLSAAMLDRLTLSSERLAVIIRAVRELKALPDPVGRLLEKNVRPNGLVIEKVSVPIGVIGMIYEARPNVTVDAAMIALKAGNAVILRGGSESFLSNTALEKAIREGLEASDVPADCVQLIASRDREAVNILVKLDAYVDLIIPRGGESLIRAVTNAATVPVIKHYKGVCHLFIDESASSEMAVAIALNGKCQRPGVCNALEKVLIHRNAKKVIPLLADALTAQNVELRGDSEFCKLVPSAIPASEADWETEYLNLTLTVKIVDSLTQAIDWINRHGSHHSDAIVTESAENAKAFLSRVRSATVYHNASTRFTDGAEFGMGAEIGISTDKLHARGPMGLPELTTYQYQIKGSGQIR